MKISSGKSQPPPVIIYHIFYEVDGIQAHVFIFKGSPCRKAKAVDKDLRGI
jgi:hypothetical protein